ncbi:hypothetical protein [Cohnella soli]|uniref:DUF4432 domain-containing protein n=1 Tax=Cohnella soli TaxID=425005 RepID=A0ABW0HQM3_9BACL
MRADRNYGCRIKTDLQYKGYAMIVMENELFRLSVLPGKGTDVIELLYKPADMDFAWLTQLGLRRAETAFADFQSRYEGGWQEIFPSLSGEHVYEGTKLATYGEAWLAEWDYAVVCDDEVDIAVRFEYKLRAMPFRIKKTIAMRAGEPGFRVSESIANESPATVYADWGHHITFGTPYLQPGVVVELPRTNGTIVMPERGAPGGFDVLDDLSEGLYRLIRPDGLGAQVQWDLETWPYLWFWRDFGADKGGPYYGCHYNIGLEMFTSPPAASLADSRDAGTAIRFGAWEERRANLAFRVIDETNERKDRGMNDVRSAFNNL